MTENPSGPEAGATFGPAREGDLAALVAIDSESSQPWSAVAFAAELQGGAPTVFVLRFSGPAIAFVVVRFHVPEMDIVNLVVDGRHRQTGLGRFLLRSVLDHGARLGVETVFLEVREGNRAARDLYASLGFRETQKRPAFYNRPVEDAVLLRLEIAREPGLKGPRNAC